MTNAVVYHLASAQAFLSGSLAVALAAFFLAFAPREKQRRPAAIVVCVGVALAVLSAAPLGIAFYLIAVGVTVAAVGASGLPATRVRRVSQWLCGAAAVAWLCGTALEAPWHVTPTIDVPHGAILYVVGDSLSAPDGTPDQAWPALVARRTKLDVRNLAEAGATTRSALEQLARIDHAPAVVLVEIGGNDLLGPRDGTRSAERFDELLSQLRAGGHTIVLFELPLPPLANAYGSIQRRLARRHGAVVVPRRVLLRAITARGGAIDSLHLSKAGHSMLAADVAALLQPAQ